MNGFSSAFETSRKPSVHVNEFQRNFVNEEHIKAFAEALAADDYIDPSEAPSPGSPQGAVTPSGRRVRKVSALSDFAPVNQRVTRRRKPNSRHHEKRQEWLFILLRWPLLTIIFLLISLEFGLYVVIRQLVNTKEWLIAWRGRKGQLRKKLRGSQTYEEWKEAALELDAYLHFDSWKTVDEDPYYDWKLVRKVLRTLRNMRANNDVHGVLGVLETCIRTNFAGIESPRLYSETFYGTKDLIEAYITEQEKALEWIRESPDLTNEEKKRFFRNANTNLGSTALCLSGGASFGYYHFGVVKAFLDVDLLPRVISGTSAGGLVAAMVCTRTDEELKQLLVPELANCVTACEDPLKVWFKRFWETGARFDSVTWARKATFFTRGSMTFKEAYLRTGRILNISVIPADRHSPTKLLNYLTAPDTVIWSALLASAAVPGILNPVVLMQKTKDDSLVPWNWGSKFKDGSLRVDIPVQSLNLYFNVTHPIVSQANPHVHLFFFAPRGSAGKPVATRKGKGKSQTPYSPDDVAEARRQGWRGNFILSAAEQWLKLELTKNFKVIRDLDLLPTILGQDWSSVFLQRFDGAVTIWPRTRLQDWLHILTDPDKQELERMIRVGELVTWPKLHIIENRYRLEKKIYLGRRAVRKAVQSKAQTRAEAEPQGKIPTPVIDTKLASPALALSLSGSGESPVPMDSDVEQAYAQSPNKPPYRLSHSRSIRTSSSTLSGVNNRSMTRRRWPTTGNGADGEDGDSGDDMPDINFGRASPDPPPERDAEERELPVAQDPLVPSSSHIPSSPSALFKRLRTASFSPFATIRRGGFFGANINVPVEQDNKSVSVRLASSESSSDEDDDLSLASRRIWNTIGDSQSDDDEDGRNARFGIESPTQES